MEYVKILIMYYIGSENMGWKKSSIIYLIILVSIEAKLISEYMKERSVCSFKRISCLNETSFKFCFSSETNTYLYGNIKTCPNITVCSEYEGINACIKVRKEFVNIHRDNALKGTNSTSSSENTMISPAIEITTERQITETTAITKWLSPTSTPIYEIHSTGSSELPETNVPVGDVLPSQFPHGITHLTVPPTEQLISETTEAITSSDKLRATEDSSNHQFLYTPETSTVATDSQSTYSIISSYHQPLSEATIVSTTIKYLSDQYSIDFRKPTQLVSYKTTPTSTTNDYSSKVTKRKRKSTTSKIFKKRRKKPISSTHSYFNTIPIKIISSHTPPQSISKLSTKSPSVNPSKLPSTEYVRKTTSKLPTKPKNPLLMTISTSTYSEAVDSTKNYESSTMSTKTPESSSTSTKNPENSAMSPLASTGVDMGDMSTTIQYFHLMKTQSTNTTLFPCQHYLLKLLSRTTPANNAALTSPIKTTTTTPLTVKGLRQTEVQDATPPSACTDAGKYPSKNCNEYYECLKVMWWYRLMYRKCRKRERFDHLTLQCVPDIMCT